jgi:NifU-like protein involved in Fe-S cluster formation
MKEHFTNPKNMGKVKNATNKSKYKSGFCGDTVEVSANIVNGVITELKYNVFGCYAVISTASILSEWAKQKTIDEVHNITYDEVLLMLGGEIDPEKVNCVKTAITAFHKL